MRRLELEVRKRLGELRALLGRRPAEAPRVIENLIDGRIHFPPLRTDQGCRYVLKGKIAAGALFSIESDPDGI